ncbi:uncharacterized protein LOC132728554, partial [Ruditapes philippinarum]|uniref:uncharacterized protein LOC132728554 n=1 Tax=Ruditapes philippinarum TaxID=129788 RepID=UPI00295B0773
CDFDDDFCNWLQYDGDDFNWDRMKGKTKSHSTGPSVDHTSGHGYYTYIKTSNRKGHAKAILLSPTLNAGKYCLSFWYYMYGSGIDRLRLQLWQRNGTKETISTVKSEQGQQWFHNWIAFEGRVKNDWSYIRSQGDIAIDDVTLFSCNDCNDPRPSHSVANSTNYKYGSVMKIQCKNGYSIQGESVIVCEAMGLWSGSATCIPHDCGNISLPNGNFITPHGTMFGQVGRKECNTGFILNGEPNVRCTANGWSNTTSHCILVDVETNSSPLIVVYILVPAVFLMIAAICTVLYMRKRNLSCMKVLKTFKRAREVPSRDSLQEKSHSNQMYSNEDLQLDDEYATISGEQTDDKNLSTGYYAAVDRSGKKKKSNQTKSTDGNKSACSIDLNECNTYNVLNAKALNNSLKGGEERNFDYDSACTRQMKNEASNRDDYSHIGDLEMKYQHTQHFPPQPDIEKNTEYSHIDRISSTSTKVPKHLETDYHDYDEYQNPVVKEKKVLEKHAPKIKQIEDKAPDYNNVAQTKEMYESNESENHDYFILEKT